jgi:hypothetical protein
VRPPRLEGNKTEDDTMNKSPPKDTFKPVYSPWRHGGWYVHNVRYPSGACGCVSRNYPDGKWRVVCDERDPQPTYSSRDAAALAELELTLIEARGAAMTNESQHTPEPWAYQLLRDHDGVFYKITDEQGVTIADVPVNPFDPPEWPAANARLIAAAPDLLNAVEQVFEAAEDGGDMDNIDWKMLRGAIAKVQGVR